MKRDVDEVIIYFYIRIRYNGYDKIKFKVLQIKKDWGDHENKSLLTNKGRRLRFLILTNLKDGLK